VTARHTPLGALGRGLVAGAAGTAAMTGAQALGARLRGGAEEGDGGADGNGGPPRDPWEHAPAPAKVGRRVIEGVFRRQVPPERIGLLTNVMHWGYGTMWGAVFGLVRGSGLLRGAAGGAAFGAAVWAGSYAQLVPMGIYDPPWTYPPGVLAEEGAYHLAYGLGVAAGWAALDR
jgi:hypothetical protein